jgi:isoquinoline 1-oxidoreductase alpha subunit
LELEVNGRRVALDVPDDVPLLFVLREELGLTGAKYGCGAGLCGACTVHLDGSAVRSCVTPVGAAAGHRVTTIEGLSPDRSHVLQRAWLGEQVPQCGYCQPGMLLAAAALLSERPGASADELAASITNLCRCGTYPRVRRALRRALAELRGG